MISETFFASNYISIWRTIAPTMEEFVRKTNLDGYTRIWPPLLSRIDPTKRGVVNEAGFILFSKAAKRDSEPDARWAGREIGPSFEQARIRLHGTADELRDDAQSAEEENEALEIFGRLYTHYLRNNSNEIQVDPEFPGCGIINSCYGDIIINNNSIVEIKSGDRNFRSIDYRQLSVYCALRYAHTKKVFQTITAMNPRTGVYVEIDFQRFAFEISGNSPVQFCQNLIDNFIARFNSN